MLRAKLVQDLRRAGCFAAQHGHLEACGMFEKAAANAKGVEEQEQEQFRRMEGWALLNLGTHEDALRAFEQARQLAESDELDEIRVDEDLLAGLSIASLLAGRSEAARDCYRALITLSAERAEAKTIEDLGWPTAEKTPLEEARKLAVGSPRRRRLPGYREAHAPEPAAPRLLVGLV